MVVRFHRLLLDKRQMLKKVLYIVDIYEYPCTSHLTSGTGRPNSLKYSKQLTVATFASWFLPYSEERVKKISSKIPRWCAYCLSSLHPILGMWTHQTPIISKQEAKVGAVKRILGFMLASLDTGDEKGQPCSSVVVHPPRTCRTLGPIASPSVLPFLPYQAIDFVMPLLFWLMVQFLTKLCTVCLGNFFIKLRLRLKSCTRRRQGLGSQDLTTFQQLHIQEYLVACRVNPRSNQQSLAGLAAVLLAAETPEMHSSSKVGLLTSWPEKCVLKQTKPKRKS